MKSKNKQILFIICLVVLIIGVVLFYFLRGQQESYSSDYKDSERKDTVEYDGKEYRYNEHLSNFVFMGVDTREPITEYETREEAGRADAIYLLSYDRVQKTLKCISIPRDTITNVHVIAPDGTDLGISKEHINIQYAFGDGKDESCRLVKEAVSDMLRGVPIQGYCSLNMDGIAVAVDVLGGVEVTVPNDSMEDVSSEYTKGSKVLITKENAEKFIRYRDITVAQSAHARTERQKELMKAVSEQAKVKSAKDTDFIVDMHERLKPYMVSNIGNDVLAKLLEAKFDSEDGIVDIPGEKIEGELYDEYHIDETKLYELVLELFYEEV